MKYPKIDPAKSQAGQVSEHREPYEPPTVTVVPLKIEERLLTCAKLTKVACGSPARLS
jgi:hypothetical protein